MGCLIRHHCPIGDRRRYMEMLTLVNAVLTGINVVILGLAVKLYSEATKTHIFTKKDGRGV